MLKNMIELSIEEARRIALSAGLGFHGLPETKAKNKSLARAASAAVFERTSWIQIDTISVVERAHHHAMWSRNPDYDNDHIPKLESPDDPGQRRIVEYWSHAAAYIPVEDLRYCLPRMERIRSRGHDWFEVDYEAVDRVLAKIRDEGALQSRDFDQDKKHQGGWWNWKPAKRALEYLFHGGLILIKTRQGFQKVFDLAERVVPGFEKLATPGDGELAAWYLDRAERELGLFQAKDIGYLRKDGLTGVSNELKRRVADGRIHHVKIDGLKGWYVCESALQALHGPSRRFRPGIRILSPFDPFVINRSRLQQLYGFEFTIECYVPEAKRIFGYFALPLLWIDADGRSHFVGKIDAKVERDKGVLRVHRLAWEAAVSASKRPAGIPTQKVLEEQLAKSLKAFAAFNGAESVDALVLSR